MRCFASSDFGPNSKPEQGNYGCAREMLRLDSELNWHINNLEKQKTSRNMNTLPAHSLGQNPLKILDFLTSIFRLEKRTVCLSWQLVLLLQTENQSRAKQLNAEKRVLLTLFHIKKCEGIDISLRYGYNGLTSQSGGYVMKRDISNELLVWKEQPKRKPLVLKGVRQCGKTYILKEFGKENYSHVAYFNFEETKSLSSIFEQDYDVKRILFELGLFLGQTITPGSTLIIFDEIQECPRAITALKYFCENAPEYHVACAGSLLGLAIHAEQSFPVGKVDIHTLYPMSFYEFLAASGEELLADYLIHLQPGDIISELIGGKLRTALKQYYVIGGMPEAVSTWCETKDLQKVEAVQQGICKKSKQFSRTFSPATSWILPSMLRRVNFPSSPQFGLPYRSSLPSPTANSSSAM